MGVTPTCVAPCQRSPAEGTAGVTPAAINAQHEGTAPQSALCPGKRGNQPLERAAAYQRLSSICIARDIIRCCRVGAFPGEIPPPLARRGRTAVLVCVARGMRRWRGVARYPTFCFVCMCVAHASSCKAAGQPVGLWLLCRRALCRLCGSCCRLNAPLRLDASLVNSCTASNAWIRADHWT